VTIANTKPASQVNASASDAPIEGGVVPAASTSCSIVAATYLVP
jgi:hypothetical protein